MGHRFQVTFDANDPDALARFWAVALDFIPQPPPENYDTWDDFAEFMGIPADERDRYGAVIDQEDGRRLLFLKVPEGKTAKNRVHLDIHVSGDRDLPAGVRWKRIEAHADKLAEHGATEVARHEEYGSAWVVMQDPEGNEFCIV